VCGSCGAAAPEERDLPSRHGREGGGISFGFEAIGEGPEQGRAAQRRGPRAVVAALEFGQGFEVVRHAALRR
jgi:hypothetical protein